MNHDIASREGMLRGGACDQGEGVLGCQVQLSWKLESQLQLSEHPIFIVARET